MLTSLTVSGNEAEAEVRKAKLQGILDKLRINAQIIPICWVKVVDAHYPVEMRAQSLVDTPMLPEEYISGQLLVSAHLYSLSHLSSHLLSTPPLLSLPLCPTSPLIASLSHLSSLYLAELLHASLLLHGFQLPLTYYRLSLLQLYMGHRHSGYHYYSYICAIDIVVIIITGMNSLIKEHSVNSAVVFSHLPTPPTADTMYEEYLHRLTLLTDGLPPTVLVHGLSPVMSTTL